MTRLYFFTCQVCNEPYQIKDGIKIEVDGGYGTKSPCCGDVAPHWYSYGGEWTPPEDVGLTVADYAKAVDDGDIVYAETGNVWKETGLPVYPVTMKVVKFSEWIKDPDAFLEETE